MIEHHNQKWAKKMTDFLLEIKTAVETHKEDNRTLEMGTIEKYEQKYNVLNVIEELFNEGVALIS